MFHVFSPAAASCRIQETAHSLLNKCKIIYDKRLNTLKVYKNASYKGRTFLISLISIISDSTVRSPDILVSRLAGYEVGLLARRSTATVTVSKGLVSLGSDGPRVNKAVFRYISEAKKPQDLYALVDIGICILWIIDDDLGKQ